MDRRILFAMFWVLATLLAGCGSSSSGAPDVNGVFADAPVVGLGFSCGGQKGVTASGGAFTCPGLSTVTVTVGGVTVCSAPVQKFMTPVSCAQATNSSASTATPSVVGVARFLQSISTTPASSGTLTVTSTELTNAAGLTLNFSTADDATLLAAVVTTTGNPGATLVDAATAQAQLASVVIGSVVGNFSGTFSGAESGTWTMAIASDGSVSGTGTPTSGSPVTISGHLVSGTQYSGTAGTATWTGNVDTSKSPMVFSGTWTDGAETGTFTGHN